MAKNKLIPDRLIQSKKSSQSDQEYHTKLEIQIFQKQEKQKSYTKSVDQYDQDQTVTQAGIVLVVGAPMFPTYPNSSIGSIGSIGSTTLCTPPQQTTHL
jgi:hypothetical protein